jgi:hypothetical protein
VLRHEADQRFIGLALSGFLASVRFTPAQPLSSPEAFSTWFDALCGCVMDIYGKANSVVLLGTVATVDNSMNASEVAITPTRRLQEIIDQQHFLKTRRGFAPELSRTTLWYEYLDGLMPSGYLD